jgi:hypothetical protein
LRRPNLISVGDPRLSRHAYSLRIDKFVRAMKADFRSLGHSIVKFECELMQFRFLQKPKLFSTQQLPLPEQ